MKGISERDLPESFHYQIHSHNGLNGQEHEAHVHIYSRRYGIEVKYSLNSGVKIEGEYTRAVTRKQIISIEEWVSQNLPLLRREWAEADSPNGGR